MYRLLGRPAVEKDLRRLPHSERTTIHQRILSLSANPRQRQTEKLSAREGYRLRLGNYLILYEIDDHSKTITVNRVLHRREAYR